MTIKKNFNYYPNSAENYSKKNPNVSSTDNVNYKYVDSYMKNNRFSFGNVNNPQDQRFGNLPNYNTEIKQQDFSTSKFSGNYYNTNYNSSSVINNFYYTESKNKIYSKIFLRNKKILFSFNI